MAAVFGKLFVGGCTLGFLGVTAGAIQYRREFGNMPTDLQSTLHAFTTFSSDTRRDVYDVAIVGGGIVGVATAREIRAKYPNKRVILLEKEADVAQHQSGHNSGCIHAGMYYKPGTAMARLCPRGHDLIVEYCKANNVPYELCGKLIVAVNDEQVKTIEQVYANGVANGVKDMKLLYGEEEIKKKEPNITGMAAIWSPQTGITDFAAVTRHMLKGLSTNAKMFASQFQFEAQDFIGVHLSPKEEVVLIRGRESGHHGPEKTVAAKSVITCCGLNNDALAKKSGNVLSRAGKRIVQTYSFRGRYYQLTPEKRGIIKSHVYPCPDTRKGMSVGVHFTPTLDERRGRQVIIGPGSALAWDRFGYSPYLIDIEYLFNCAFSKGGWVSLFSNASMILQMYYMDFSRAAFLREAQKLIPEIENKDIEDSFCGVQAIGIDEAGSLAKDLSIEFCRPQKTFNGTITKDKQINILSDSPMLTSTQPLIVNVRNAPSPAATACMSIAEDIVENAAKNLGW